MPEYTVAQILAAFRAENPDAAHIDDKELFRAIAMEDPDLVKGASNFKTETKPQAGPVERFFSSGAEAIKGAVSGAYHAVADAPATPAEKVIDSGVGGRGFLAAKRVLVDPQIDQAKKALESYRSGNYSEMVGHGLAAAVPVYGPAAAQVGEQAGTGDFAGAAGTAAGYFALDRTAKKIGEVNKAATPEALQDLATKARMYRAAHPSALEPITHGSLINPIRIAKALPEATRGAIGGAAAVAAPVLDAAAKAKIAMGAAPRGATYEPPTTLDRIVEPTPEISPARQDTGYTPKFSEAEVGSPSEIPPPAGDFSPLAKGPDDAAHYGAIDEARMNQILGIVEPEQITGSQVTPAATPAEAPVETPIAETPVAEAPPVERAVPPNVEALAHALIRRGRGAVAADRALTNAKYLLDMMPELEGLSDIPDRTGVAPLDRAITEKLDTVGHEINAKLKAGAGKQVSTADAVVRLKELIDEARNANQTTAALKIAKLIKILGTEGTATGELVTSLRQGMQESGLKLTTRIGSDVYDVFRNLTKNMDPDLPALNQQYFTAKTAAELAEIRTGGPSEASQMGMGTRPKAEFKEAEAAKKATAKEAETAARKAKAEEAKAARDKQKAADAKSKEELRRKESMDASARAERDRGFKGKGL